MFIIDIMMAISNWLWGWPLLILTSAVAVYLSVRFKFFQFTRFGHAMKNTFGEDLRQGRRRGADISPFQACCTALASTLGVGNIAGVSVAIATGGPAPYSGCGPWPHGLHREVFPRSPWAWPTGSGILRPADGTVLLLVCAPGAGQELEVAGHFWAVILLRHGVCARRAGQLCGGGDSGLL